MKFSQEKGFTPRPSSFRIHSLNFYDALFLNDMIKLFTNPLYIIQPLSDFFFENHITAKLLKKENEKKKFHSYGDQRDGTLPFAQTVLLYERPG